MEGTMRPSFQDIRACLVELRIQATEGVVDRCGTEHTYALAFALLYLKPLCLDDNTQALNEEDTTENRQQQLLVDYDGREPVSPMKTCAG